tara:strand:+ start:68 stop:1072 length:1005 start_codon:yes stop_codon:yes gene_type:complete
MKITSLFKLSVALIVLSSYANAVTIFSFAADSNTYPTTTAANFDNSSNDIYGTDDSGNGSGWGSGITTNFNGASSVINPGDQKTSSGSNPQTTTYFGPTFYAGINRDAYKGAGGVIHSNGNGFRIRVNSISQNDINTSAAAGGAGGTNGINFKAVFMFDADDADTINYGFGSTDTLVARIAVPVVMGTDNRAYSASYRAMVKADGEYYAGTLNTIDLSALSGSNSQTFDLTEDGASATWTLMDDFEKSNNSLQSDASHPKNLTVDGSTTVIGSQLTGITQVGFLLDTTGAVNSGGYNFGVRQFSAEATAVPEPSSYALIAGMLTLASIIFRRRK